MLYLVWTAVLLNVSKPLTAGMLNELGSDGSLLNVNENGGTPAPNKVIDEPF